MIPISNVEDDNEINFMNSIGRRRVITDRTGKIPYLIRYYVFLKDRKTFQYYCA